MTMTETKTISDYMKSKRFSSHELVHVCTITDQPTLVYPKGLETRDPYSFSVIQLYAKKFGYFLKEDQRAEFFAGVKRVKDPHRANVISVLLLAAALCIDAAQADTILNNYIDQNLLSENAVKIELNLHADYDFNHYSSNKELASKLLSWINNNTSFNHDINTIPDIKFASAGELVLIAFGDCYQMNKDIDLDIYGLYNFHEETIYLCDSVDLNDNEGKAILLHELVHYLQYHAELNHDTACINELECLAYTLEAKFLECVGEKHDISEKFIRKISTCGAAHI